tara:strand:- start:14015 stop:14644 length:630 start_codon:yes stop_codon:yes gene_type:complete
MKAIFFDLDGVLVDACDWHYLALNRALDGIGIEPISRQDHETTYNGLPTAVKLEMLGLHEDECALVWKLKQDYTLKTIRENAIVQTEKIELFQQLHSENIKCVCVTNSIRETTTEMLKQTGQFEHIEFIIANEDVDRNKPYPDCYNLAVEKIGCDPSECVIVEDSPKGLEAAKESTIPNSNIWKVKNSTEVTLENYRRFIDENFNSNGR